VALRLGVYQLRFLERIPESAAVNESVELVKRARKRSAAGLVNALLRKIAKEPERPPSVPTSTKGIADEYAHPSWLVERWVVQFGIEVAAQICKHDQEPPPISLRVHPQHNHSQLDAEL